MKNKTAQIKADCKCIIKRENIDKLVIETINEFNITEVFELCKNLSGVYLRHADNKKRILLKLLCSNFFYDGSKLTITIKEPFKALIKFAVFKKWASDGTRHEPNYAELAQMCLHETEVISDIEKWCA